MGDESFLDASLSDILKNETPGSVSSTWLPDGTGFRSQTLSHTHSEIPKTEDLPVTWVVPSPKVMYLVSDESRVFKSYKDRYFLFTKPEAALAKAKELGFESLWELRPEDLKVGIRHFCEYGGEEDRHVSVSIIAVEVN